MLIAEVKKNVVFYNIVDNWKAEKESAEEWEMMKGERKWKKKKNEWVNRDVYEREKQFEKQRRSEERGEKVKEREKRRSKSKGEKNCI